MPVIWIYTLFDQNLLSKRNIATGLFAYVCLGAAVLFRLAHGLIGLSVFFLGVVVYASHQKFKGTTKIEKRNLVIRCGLLLVMGFSTLYWTSAIFTFRNMVFNIQPSDRVTDHGISHALIIGLAQEENPWGFKPSDEFAARLAQTHDPTIKFVTPEYFQFMKKLYFNLVFSHPVEVGKIYWIKFTKALQFPFPILGISIHLWAVCMILLLPILFQKYKPEKKKKVWVLVGIMLIYLLLILLSVLTVVWGLHLYPNKLIVALALFVFIDIQVRDQLKRLDS